MTIIELIKQHAAAHGFTAIYGDACGCQIGELEPCERINIRDCSLGYWNICECGHAFASPRPDDTICPECKGCDE